MRAFASGLGASSDSTPARLLHLSPKAAELLLAYRDDPSWSPEALSAVVEGGVAAKAFVGWAMELERVNREQPRVEAFLRCACLGAQRAPAIAAAGRSSTAEQQKLRLGKMGLLSSRVDVDVRVRYDMLRFCGCSRLVCDVSIVVTLCPPRPHDRRKRGRKTNRTVILFYILTDGHQYQHQRRTAPALNLIFDYQRCAASMAPQRTVLPKTPTSVRTPRRRLPPSGVGRTDSPPTPGNTGTSVRRPGGGDGGAAEST